MTMIGDLVGMVTMCDRGDVMIINKEVRFERSRHRSAAECTITLGRAHVHDRSSLGFMERLLRAFEDNAIRLEQMRRHYDERESYCELTFYTEMSTYEWINQDEDGRRIGRVSSVNRPGRSREFRREILGEFRPTAAPHPEPTRDDRVDAMYAYRMLGLNNAAEEIVRRETVQAYNRASNIANIPIRGVSGGLMIIDDPLVPEGEVVLSNMSCKIGDPDSHKWVEVPHEGPTAKRCSACLRVTGQFWTPDDRRQAIEWLVTNTKILVRLWASNLDATAVRYSLLETDSSVKRAEEPSSDDTDTRFSLLELK